jgi:hypothetical protein
VTDGELSFYYHVTGDILEEISLSTLSRISTDFKVQIYVPVDSGLSFWYNIAGDITAEYDLRTVSNLELSKSTKKIVSVDLITTSKLDFWKQARYLRILDLHTVSTMVPETILNAGYVDVIQFGSLVLKSAKPSGTREYSFPCAEKRLLDGSRSLHVRAGTSYIGKFTFETDNYADIQALFNMIGTLQTLRVYGVPYRNCMIWSPIEVKQYKPKLARWVINMTVYQDTSRTGITS